MKLLLIALTVLSSFFATANDHPISIPAAATTAFKASYKEATNVHWSLINSLYRAQFTYHNQLLYAFYNSEGECVSVGEIIEFDQLPVLLQIAYNKKKLDAKLIDVFEVSSEMGTSYYMTIETAEERIILKSADTNKWEVNLKKKIR